jgi:hypothetical protein
MSGDNQGVVLQERDRHLFSELADMRVADAEQAMVVAGFGSVKRAKARLLQLVRAGLLKRFFIGPRSGMKGKSIYAHSSRGAAFAGVPDRGPQRIRDEALVADFFVEHQLAVNDIYCAVKYPGVPAPDVCFRRWLAFYERIVPALPLIPDGYFELETPSGILAAFVEVDLGNETLAIWKEKVANYLQLAISGEFKRRFGEDQFRVLVIVPSERRFHSIRKAVAAMTPKIFWFACQEEIRQSGVFAPVWFRPVGDDKQQLIRKLS